MPRQAVLHSKCLDAQSNGSQRKPLAGKQQVIFPAVLQALRHHCVRRVLSAQEAGQRNRVRDAALRHCFSRASCAETPAWNKSRIIPGGQPGQWFEGGVKPFAISWVTGKENISFQGPWERNESVFLVPQGQKINGIPQAESVPQPASGGCAERLGQLWGPLLTSCQHRPEGRMPRRAASCHHLLRVGLNLPCHLFIMYGKEALVGCALFCFTALPLYGPRAFPSLENSSSPEDATGMPMREDTHEQNCLWNRNLN